jgi:ribonuclease PH
MNVVMTGSGEFVELQATGEKSSFSELQLGRLIEMARAGIGELIAAQKKTLAL